MSKKAPRILVAFFIVASTVPGGSVFGATPEVSGKSEAQMTWRGMIPGPFRQVDEWCEVLKSQSKCLEFTKRVPIPPGVREQFFGTNPYPPGKRPWVDMPVCCWIGPEGGECRD
jgi:hypothetical protein